MKWFQHISNTGTMNKRVSKLINKFGGKGYAVYIFSLELVANELSYEKVDCTLPWDADLIAEKFKFEVEEVQNILDYMASDECGLCKKTSDGYKFSKIMEYLDRSMSQNPQIQKTLKKYKGTIDKD